VAERAHAAKHTLLSLGVQLPCADLTAKKRKGKAGDKGKVDGSGAADIGASMPTMSPLPGAPDASESLMMGDLLGSGDAGPQPTPAAPTPAASAAAPATASLLGDDGDGDGGGGGSGGGALGSPEAAAAAKQAAGSARACGAVLACLTKETTEPVNPKAQRKVPRPEGLDLGTALDPAALASL